MRARRGRGKGEAYRLQAERACDRSDLERAVMGDTR